jgi:SAM-dependent methyltransferase
MSADGPSCAACDGRVGDPDGLLRFVRDAAIGAEAAHYEQEYDGAAVDAPTDLESLGQLYTANPYAPFNRTVLDGLRDIKGQDVVLLGNGVGAKELYLLTRGPRTLVYSDLSANAVREVRDRFAGVLDGHPVFFAVIDAMDLPFADESVDAVYGYAFVHHLGDMRGFLGEIARVLRPGGRAVFMDNAYSPLWQTAKRRWLNPVMRLAHRHNPISDEDRRFTLGGGFRREEVGRHVDAVGCELWWEPSGMLHYLATRADQVLGRGRPWLGARRWIPTGTGAYRLEIRNAGLLRALDRADAALARRLAVVRDNRLRLVWGLRKPPRGDGA